MKITPTTNLDAIYCGIDTVAYSSGGTPETLKNKYEESIFEKYKVKK